MNTKPITEANWTVDECWTEGVFYGSYMVTKPDAVWPDDPEERQVVCRLPTGCGKHSEHLQVARLISAAPDLLEALQAAWEHLQYCGYGDKWERDCAKSVGLDDQIRAAIAKATGGAS